MDLKDHLTIFNDPYLEFYIFKAQTAEQSIEAGNYTTASIGRFNKLLEDSKKEAKKQ